MTTLFVKRRPTTLDGMVGNQSLRDSVNALITGKQLSEIPHAWLFAGASGMGKTTIARIIARRMQAASSSIYELNGANTRGIDAVRELISTMDNPPISGFAKVYIIDECHQLTKEAQNALLKPIEDAPDHVFFILLTSEPGGLIPAIKSRCKSFTFRAVSSNDLEALATDVIAEEHFSIANNVVQHAIKQSGGSPRMLLNMLETAAAANTEKAAIETIDQMQSGLLDSGNAFSVANRLFSALGEGGTRNQMWSEVSSIIDGEVYKAHLDAKAVRVCLANIVHSFLIRSNSNAAAGTILEVLFRYDAVYGNANAILTCIMHKIVQEITDD